MNIFFTAPYSGKKKFQTEFDLIRQTLDTHPDVKLISPEKGNYLQILSPTDPIHTDTNRRVHYEAIRKGIEWADAVVFEVSEECFQLGHEMTLAIQSKKHVLCLSLFENFERKIFSKYFHGARYTKETLVPIINKFIARCQKESLPNRFNFFLSHSQIRFLEATAKQKGMSVAEYLRTLIDNERQ